MDKQVRIPLTGRIDSTNAPDVEKQILDELAGVAPDVPVALDFEKLDYISSAGLRVILRLKKNWNDLTVENVNSDIFETLEMTGFTEMMTVKKAYRVVSVEGCEVIGEGANGKVYRIDSDNVVKTYKNADALAEIQHEREVARLALILGVPTAISYDVVRVGDSYGSVFELLNAKSFSKLLANEPDKYDFCVSEYVKMLKKIHSIEVPEGKLPKIKEKVLSAVTRVKDTLPDGLGDKLLGIGHLRAAAKAVIEQPLGERVGHGRVPTAGQLGEPVGVEGVGKAALAEIKVQPGVRGHLVDALQARLGLFGAHAVLFRQNKELGECLKGSDVLKALVLHPGVSHEY